MDSENPLAGIRGRCDLFSGDDNLNIPILAVGGAGVISVVSNVCPAEVKKVITLMSECRIKEANELQDRLLPLIDACFVEVNPIPVKEAMDLLGFNAGVPRAPLTPLEKEHRDLLKAEMLKFGLEVKA